MKIPSQQKPDWRGAPNDPLAKTWRTQALNNPSAKTWQTLGPSSAIRWQTWRPKWPFRCLDWWISTHCKADKEVTDEDDDFDNDWLALIVVVSNHRWDQLKHPRNTWLGIRSSHHRHNNNNITAHIGNFPKFTKNDKYSEDDCVVFCFLEHFLKACLFLPGE